MNRKSILFICFCHFFCDVNTGSLPAMLPYLREAHGLSYSMTSGLMLANASLSSVLQPLFGLWADRRPRLWYMPLGILTAGCCMAGAGLFSGYWAIFLTVMASGIGAALFHPAAVRFANRVSGSAVGTGMSIFSVGGNTGFLLAPILAVALIHQFGLRGLGLLAPLAMGLAAFALYESARLAKSARAAGASSPKRKAAAPAKNDWRAFSRLTVNIVCRSIIIVCMRAFIPLYWIARFSQSEAQGALALTVFGGFGIAGNILGGMLADRYGYRKVIRLGHLAFLPMLAVLPFVSSLASAYVLLAALGFALFVPFSSLVVMGQRYLGGNVGFASGITLGLGMSIGGLAAPVLGRIADLWGLGMTFHSLTLFALAGTAMAFFLPPAPPLQPAGD